MRAPSPLRAAGDWLRDLPYYFSRNELLIAAGAAAIAVIVALVLIVDPLGGAGGGGDAEVITVVVGEQAGEEVGTLGFPLVATRNTTRIPGPDPVADAAAVALATHPAAAEAAPLEVVSLVDESDWQSGLAAASLAGAPLRAPILIGSGGGVPEPTAEALDRLKPRGGSGPGDAQLLALGDVAVPDGYQTERIEGANAAAIAAAFDRVRQRLTGRRRESVLLVSEEQAPFAMPAAAWAARSGDPILFTDRDTIPEPTLKALRRHRGATVYIVGPAAVISDSVLRQVARAGSLPRRIGAADPVSNAIAFARYADAEVGWNINDPGHGLIVAAADRPLDAAAAAPLSASGMWGPLLLVEDAAGVPDRLRQFMLDIKPGYKDDPTRAVYNHVWVIGDQTAIGAAAQAEIDELAELAPIGDGGQDALAQGLAVPGQAEPEHKPKRKRNGGP